MRELLGVSAYVTVNFASEATPGDVVTGVATVP